MTHVQQAKQQVHSAVVKKLLYLGWQKGSGKQPISRKHQ